MSRFDVLVGELCDEIDSLKWQLEESKREEKYWRDRHNEVVDGSLKHSQEMMGNLVKSLLKPSLVEWAESVVDENEFKRNSRCKSDYKGD